MLMESKEIGKHDDKRLMDVLARIYVVTNDAYLNDLKQLKIGNILG